MKALYLRADPPGLLFLVFEPLVCDLFSVFSVGPEALGLALFVVLYYRIGKFENIAVGSVVLFEPYSIYIREVVLEVEDISYVRAPPLVDALVVITDNAKVAVL